MIIWETIIIIDNIKRPCEEIVDGTDRLSNMGLEMAQTVSAVWVSK